MTATGQVEPITALGMLLTDDGRRDPYPIFEAIRAHGPVVPVGNRYALAVGYRECDQILRDRRMLVQDIAVMEAQGIAWQSRASLAQVAHSMVNVNPPDHARLRGPIAGAFTARRVAALRPAVTRRTDELLDRMAAAGPVVDFMTDFAYRLPVAIVADLLGAPEADHALLRETVTALVRAYDEVHTRSNLGPSDAARETLARYFTGLVASRRRQPAEDLTTALVAAHDRGELTEEELVANLILLLEAGYETTSHLLGNALGLAFAHPGHLPRLREDPDFAASFVAEVLRYESPVQSTVRRTSESVSIGGHTLPAGTDIKVLVGAAQRDPGRFEEPARFDPERTDHQGLGFGAGAHFCLGATLARMEAEVSLPRLWRRFPDLAPAGPDAMRNSMMLRGYDRLLVQVGQSAPTRKERSG